MNARTILIAEDDTDFRRTVGRFLKRHGYHVITAEDAYQAFEVALRDRPDLLVLDVHMPAGDGFSVHERLLRHAELELTPVIYMTHDLTHKIEVDAKRDGAITLLHKPFELDELLEIVQRTIGAASADAA